MDKLTPQLNEQQLKGNIDALVKQNAPKDTVQKYIDNYKKDINGNFVLKNPPAPSNTNPDGTPKANNSIIGSEINFGHSIGDALYAGHGADLINKIGQDKADMALKVVKQIHANRLIGKDTTGLEKAYVDLTNTPVPSLGDIIPSANKTNKQILGEAGGVLTDLLAGGGALSPAVTGGAIGLTKGMQNNESAGKIAIDTVLGAVTGKVLDVGFQKASPYVTKAIEKYGMPAFDKLAAHIPEEAKTALKDLATKVTEKLSLGTGEGGNVLLDKTLNNPVEKVLGPIATKTEDIIKGSANAITNKITGAVDKVLPATAEDNVARVVKVTGKTSLSSAASNKTIKDSTAGLDIIRQNAPNIQVTDINGVAKPFEPSKANFLEMPQALKQTKDAVYKEYTSVAKNAGDAGVTFGKTEFSDLGKTLSKYDGKGYTPAFSTKAKQFKEALARFKGKATPEEIQGLIEQVNLDANPLSDKAGAQVANEFSSELRKALDSKLESSGNPAYQATRDKYSKLKALEPSIIARYKEALRQAGAKPDIIDQLTSLDAVYSLLTKNPTQLGLSIGAKVLKKTVGQLYSPETSLQRAFKFLGGDVQAPEALTTPDAIWNYAKNNNGISVDAAGNTPTKGFAVAPSKATEVKVPVGTFTPQNIAEYKQKFANELSKPNAHFGIWNDGENWVMDVSHVVDSKAKALTIGAKGSQDSIWDISKGESIPVKKTSTAKSNMQKKTSINGLSKKAIEANTLLENSGYTIADLLDPKKQAEVSDILAGNGIDYGKIADEFSKLKNKKK